MSNTKKIALMSTLVLLLAVTAIFNFVLAGTSASATTATPTDTNYFTSYRSERATTRSEEFLQLDSIIAACSADSPEYLEAVALKQEMVQTMEDELVLESLIKSIGFSDVAVTIGENNINVFINADEVDLTTTTKIFQICENETPVHEGNMIIMPVYAES